MNLTEAYIISIPETFLIIAVSILIINGLVGLDKKPVITSQNILLGKTTAWCSSPSARIEGQETYSKALTSESQLAERSLGSEKLVVGTIPKRKVDKSVIPLGILSVLLASILLSNISVTYVGRFLLDDYSKTIKLIILIGSAVIFLIGLDVVKNVATARLRNSQEQRSKDSTANVLEPNLELVVLIMLALVGIMIIISSYDLLSLYVGIELQSLALYVLAAYKRSSEFSTEAGLKYFILGAISSGFILFGSSIIYGVTGTIHFEEIAKVLLLQDPLCGKTIIIGLLFVLSGLFFKASIAPFHQWTPDVYEGSPTLITLLFASIPKLAILGIVVRIFSLSFEDTSLSTLNTIVMTCAVLSMTIGAITGLYQQKIKRLLAYSTILNMGYVLIGLVSFSIDGLQSLFFYLIVYLFTNIGVFTFLLAVKEVRATEDIGPNGEQPAGHFVESKARLTTLSLVYITDLQKLRNQPLLAFGFVILIASFAGFPPLAGFFAKLYVFFSAIAFQYYLLLFVAIIMSVISCFYYLRLIKYVYFAPSMGIVSTPASFIMPISLIHAVIISVVVLSLIVFMFYPGPLLTLSLSLALSVLA